MTDRLSRITKCMYGLVAMVSFFFVMCVSVCIFCQPAFAEEQGVDSEEELFAMAVEATDVSSDIAPQSDELKLEIDYVRPVRCNTPTIFTMIASGGAGEYKYRLYSLSVREGNSGPYQQLIDSSYMGFSTSKLFEYTFTLSGDYELRLTVFDRIPGTEQFQYTTATTHFTIVDEDAPTIAERNKQAEAKADAVWAECQAAGKKTDYDKALWLHDWVINHTTYDRSLTRYQAADVFVDGVGTCEAYHAAYMALLKRAGIPCGRVQDAGHVWTSVKIDGAWYHVDTTHDDVSTPIYGLGSDEQHLYFGLNDDTIKKVLAVNKMEIVKEVPQISATSLNANYLIRSGRIATYSDPFVSGIQANINAGKTSFSITVPRTGLAPSYKVLLYNLAAYDLGKRSWSAGGRSCSVTASYANDQLHFSVSGLTPAPDPKPTVKSIPMYRLYNPHTSEHFYTASARERDWLVADHGWKDEKVGWYAPSSGKPVYRLYNPGLGDHHYTMSASERDWLVTSHGWKDEGIGWYSGGNKPLYRQYNPGLKIGQHNYTASAPERDWLVANHGWKDEGIGWYGL